MSAGAYPNTSTVGFTYTKYLKHRPDYDEITVEQKFEDAGADYLVTAASPPQRWTLIYDVLTETQAKVLDDHYASAMGQAIDFSFTEPRNVPWSTTGSTYTGVHYESYEKDHGANLTIQIRKVTLIKRPV